MLATLGMMSLGTLLFLASEAARRRQGGEGRDGEEELVEIRTCRGKDCAGEEEIVGEEGKTRAEREIEENCKLEEVAEEEHARGEEIVVVVENVDDDMAEEKPWAEKNLAISVNEEKVEARAEKTERNIDEVISEKDIADIEKVESTTSKQVCPESCSYDGKIKTDNAKFGKAEEGAVENAVDEVVSLAGEDQPVPEHVFDLVHDTKGGLRILIGAGFTFLPDPGARHRLALRIQ